mgnify:CR=1 FL=1
MDNNSRQEAKRIGKILLRIAVTLLLIIITLVAAVSIACLLYTSDAADD